MYVSSSIVSPSSAGSDGAPSPHDDLRSVATDARTVRPEPDLLLAARAPDPVLDRQRDVLAAASHAHLEPALADREIALRDALRGEAVEFGWQLPDDELPLDLNTRGRVDDVAGCDSGVALVVVPWQAPRCVWCRPTTWSIAMSLLSAAGR